MQNKLRQKNRGYVLALVLVLLMVATVAAVSRLLQSHSTLDSAQGKKLQQILQVTADAYAAQVRSLLASELSVILKGDPASAPANMNTWLKEVFVAKALARIPSANLDVVCKAADGSASNCNFNRADMPKRFESRLILRDMKSDAISSVRQIFAIEKPSITNYAYLLTSPNNTIALSDVHFKGPVGFSLADAAKIEFYGDAQFDGPVLTNVPDLAGRVVKKNTNAVLSFSGGAVEKADLNSLNADADKALIGLEKSTGVIKNSANSTMVTVQLGTSADSCAVNVIETKPDFRTTDFSIIAQ